MTYPRVNLIRRTELRYQGKVNPQWILLGAISLTLIVTFLSGAAIWSRIHSLRTSAQSLSEEYEGLKPKVSRFQRDCDLLKDGSKVLEVLDRWQKARVSAVGLLVDLQAVVPENIQLTKLSVRGLDGKEILRVPDDVVLSYEFLLQGIAKGERAENSAIDLRKKLLESERYHAVFGSIRLDRLRLREAGAEEGEDVREFSIKGTTGGEDEL